MALTITFKNERELLRANVLYHRRFGVDQFYLYSDGGTDGTAETVGDLPFVHVASSLRSSEAPHLRKVAEAAERHHTARQILNTFDAQNRAKADQVDWLIALDADELVCPSLQEHCPGQLRGFFEKVPEPVETVRFPCLEVVQRRFRYPDAFSETLFKTPEAPIERELFDPFEGATWTHRGFYGHQSGKSAVRVNTAAAPISVHAFAKPCGVPLQTETRGWLLHYNLFSFENFLTKFRNMKDRPDRHLLSGRPISRHRRVWRDMVNNPRFSEQALAEYYRRWILFSASGVAQLREELVLRPGAAHQVLNQHT